MSSSDSAVAQGVKLSLPELSEKVKQKLESSKNSTSKPDQKKRPGVKDGESDGKKDKNVQNRDGNTKRNEKNNNKKNSQKKLSNKKGDKNNKVHQKSTDAISEDQSDTNSGDYNEEADLIHEIEELGGSKEDLELIKGIADSGSESELELYENDKGKSLSGNDSKLDTDISHYMKEIGFTVSEEKYPSKKRQEEESEKEKKTAKANHNEKKPKASAAPPAIKIEDIQHPGKAVLSSRNDWYNPDELPELPDNIIIDNSIIERLHEKAKELLNKENEVYVHDDAKTGSQKKFLSQLLSSGTLSDKLSALTLLIQNSPIHSMKYLETLLSLCKKKARRTALQGVGALKDLFVGGVLPDRKLKWFKNQPITSRTPVEWLIVWAFEDWLKGYFFSLLQILETLSHDTISNIRSNCVVHIIDLLKSKPEQEVNLLRLGVNKLGDPDRKVASRVSYLLLQLEQAHPAMKSIIIECISDLIFRSGSDYHSRYYSAITLNQTILAHKDVEVSNTLLNIYLNLFERLLGEWNTDNSNNETSAKSNKPVKKGRWKEKAKKGKKGGVSQEAKTAEAVTEEQNNKLSSAILTGLNRAYPFSDLPKSVFDKHINTLYKVTHSSNFNTSLQALILIHQISKADQSLIDRYYRTLYESLLDPRLATSSKLRLYLNLLFKSLKDDSNVARVKAFAKRIIQMATSWLSVGVVSAVVFLVRELEKSVPSLRELLDEQKSVENQEESHKDENSKYDGRKRDPVFANASNSKMWELIPLLHHYHPTVEHYSNGYLENDQSLYKPDMDLHTLSHFLDRFVYRNPKQNVTSKGGSIMQPLSGADPGRFMISTRAGAAPINASDWSKVNLEDIDVSERFFYQYFTAKQEPKSKKEKATEEDEELDEDDVWKALVESQPDVEGEGEDDLSGFSDEDLSDMEAYDDDDDEEDEENEEDYDDDEKEEGEGDEEEQEISDVDDEFQGFEDADGLLGSDDEIDVGADEESSEEEETANKGSKRPAPSVSDKKSKRQKLKDLPEFASADDYAQYLDSEDEDFS